MWEGEFQNSLLFAYIPVILNEMGIILIMEVPHLYCIFKLRLWKYTKIAGMANPSTSFDQLYDFKSLSVGVSLSVPSQFFCSSSLPRATVHIFVWINLNPTICRMLSLTTSLSIV